ncbi:MAG: type II toxin-antitoxin system VapC family toxin [Calditrichaceae bacterium]|jgi:toxin FitB
MNYLLDTCVISELIKNQPERRVISWLSNIPEEYLFLSVFTIGELHKGIEKLPDSKKKSLLHNWISIDLRTRFENRIIVFDIKAAELWGSIQSKTELSGTPMSLIDGLICSIAMSNEMTLVTRNTKDMKASGAPLLNPWN